MAAYKNDALIDLRSNHDSAEYAKKIKVEIEKAWEEHYENTELFSWYGKSFRFGRERERDRREAIEDKSKESLK